MNRPLRARAALVQSIGGVIAFLVLALPGRGLAQPTAAERVNSLRNGLRQDQRIYVDTLGGRQSVAAQASDYLSFLREDLKARVTQVIRAAGGGEVELSLRRAAVKYRLDVIHAYEDALGDRTIPRTTEWNIFSSDELAGIKQEAGANLGELLKSAVDLPDSEVPLRLRSRIRELRSQLDTLDHERSLRPGGNEPRLRTIDARISLDEARAKFSRIGAVDGAGAKVHAEHVLRFEVEMRRVGSPNDASLASLNDRDLWAPGTDLETGPGKRGPPWLDDPPPRLIDRPEGTPPIRPRPVPTGGGPEGAPPTDPPTHPPAGGPQGPPNVRGPPSRSAPLPEQLNQALIDELHAVRSRDPRVRPSAGRDLQEASQHRPSI